VLGALCREHNSSPDNPTLGIVRIHGALHSEERAAFQEIARQLCATFKCTFSRTASYDDNLVFLKEMLQQLRRCAGLRCGGGRRERGRSCCLAGYLKRVCSS